MAVKDNVLLFDADFILYYATVGNKVLDEFGNPLKQDGKFVYTEKSLEEIFKCADDIINNIINRMDFKYYVGYLGNSQSFRYKINNTYKGNRKFNKPVGFKELKEYLNIKWNFVLLNNGLEADDAVNIARNQLKDYYNVIICTGDKDLIKCIPGKYINSKDLAILRTSKEKACEAFWTSMITGDTSDNIKGLKGCGKKFAEKIFKDTSLTHEEAVMAAYKEKHGDNWMDEYSNNYQLLYILAAYDGFEVVLNSLEKEDESERDSSSKNKQELW